MYNEKSNLTLIIPPCDYFLLARLLLMIDNRTMKLIGIDIGTTTICGVLYCMEKRMVMAPKILPNTIPVPPDYTQDPTAICSAVASLIAMLKAEAAGDRISAIGFSSQMHGILYVDKQGNPVTPFYTWQNQWGREKGLEDELSLRLGYKVYTGYGIVTHKAMPAVPEEAVTFCNIGDFVAMRLAGLSHIVCDTSIAASLGIWDVEAGQVTTAFEEDMRYFPEVTQCVTLIGSYEGIPVVTPFGDNQCSFLGSVLNLESDLVLNYGTSGQLSFYEKGASSYPGFEKRPFGKDGHLHVAFSLAGGEAFQILSDFYMDILKTAGVHNEVPIYEVLDRLEYTECDKHIKCEPYFLGRRGDPAAKAGFLGITKENFSVRSITYSLLAGMAEELYSFYCTLPVRTREEKRNLIATGNGICRNRNLQRIVEEKYQKPLILRESGEGSALGAVMNALVATDYAKDYAEAVLAFCPSV